jgi:hypothetical protein
MRTLAPRIIFFAFALAVFLYSEQHPSRIFAAGGAAGVPDIPKAIQAGVVTASAACPTDPVGQIYPSDNPWNTDISTYPVLSNSANLVSSIGTSTSLHPDFGTVLDGVPWGIPFIVVNGTQPYIPVNFTAYGDESDPGPYPIPLSAPIEGGSGSTGDRHVLAFDSSNRFLYEMGNSFPLAASWNASGGAVFDTATNFQRPLTWTSADAAGLSILAGLARYEEVQCGTIRHALRMTVQTTRKAFIYPASHYASSNTSPNVPAMGQRFRLKASVNISTFTPEAKIVLQALKGNYIVNFLLRRRGDFRGLCGTWEHRTPRSGCGLVQSAS